MSTTNHNFLRILNTSLFLGTFLVFALQAQAGVARYNGPLSGDDRASATAVDSSGNVYVTGRSAGGAANGYDIATVKYAPDGRQIWAARYNGPDSADDFPFAIAVDGDYVYVTGATRRRAGGRGDLDYVTIRYSTIFLPPDRWGNIVQAAHKDWDRFYDSGARGDDSAVSIAVYSSKVFVTGYSRGVSTGGYNPGWDYATLAYEATTGNPSWGNAKRYDNGPEDKAVALAVANGFVYVTGWAVHNGQYDVVTLRYDLNGANLRQSEPIGGWPVALKTRGNFVYVAGTSGQPLAGGNMDFLVIKLDQALEREWHTVADGFGQTDYTTGLVVDSGGNVYVTGSSVGNREENLTDMMTIKFDSLGRPSGFWVYDGTPASDGPDAATAIGIDSLDNVYVTGVSFGENNQSWDYVTLRLNNGGLFYVWKQRWSSIGFHADYPTALAIDANGNVFVTGYSESAPPDYDFVTLKYSPAGVSSW
jgi:hypothetical protein